MRDEGVRRAVRDPSLRTGKVDSTQGGGEQSSERNPKAAQDAVRESGQKSGESGNPYLVAAGQLRQLLKGEGKGWTQGYREEIVRK